VGIDSLEEQFPKTYQLSVNCQLDTWEDTCGHMEIESAKADHRTPLALVSLPHQSVSPTYVDLWDLGENDSYRYMNMTSILSVE